MFVLTLIEDKIKVAPEQFNRDLTEVVVEQIEMKFANKVSCLGILHDLVCLIDCCITFLSRYVQRIPY